MKEDLRFVIKNFIYFLLYGVVCALVLGCIYLDIKHFKYLPERGFVERAQELLICVSASVFLWLAWKKNKSGLWLVGGFLACMFIRELDIVFDKIFHGAWAYVAIPVACLCVLKAWKNGVKVTIESLAEFMRTQAFTRLTTGLLTVMVFSRLIGYKPMWKLAMGKHYYWSVKFIVEEGTELFGYSIIFLAAVEYACYLLKQKED